jgi:NADH-quinone oxidoreductase subunit N
MPLSLPFSMADLMALGPFVAVLISALGVVLVDLTFDEEKLRERWIFLVGLAGSVLSASMSLVPGVPRPGRTVLGGALYADAFSNFFDLLLALLLGLILVLSWRLLERFALKPAEFATLTLLAFTGMFLMNRAGDLPTLFIAIELMSLPIYVLVGLSASNRAGREAALKYFVLGSLASAILLFGMALVYGATAQLTYAGIDRAVASDVVSHPLLLIGVALILSGLAFKIAAVPFHMWTPDVYSGAPTPVTLVMATAVKVAGSAALLRFVTTPMAHGLDRWIGLIVWLAALSMLLGNVAALRQTNVKRLLAYSSIAHAGYLLLGLLDPGRGGSAFAYYTFLYALSVLGAFGALQWFGDRKRELVEIDDFNGAARSHPIACVAFTVFLLSLAGVPPTGGFTAKFFVLSAAVRSGHVGLAILGVMTSLLGMYYYLRLVMAMWMAESDAPVPASGDRSGLWTLAAVAALILLLGCLPNWLWLNASVSTAGMV